MSLKPIVAVAGLKKLLDTALPMYAPPGGLKFCSSINDSFEQIELTLVPDWTTVGTSWTVNDNPIEFVQLFWSTIL